MHLRYLAVFFPDSYDAGVRDVIMADEMESFLTLAVDYLRDHPCGVVLKEYEGGRYRELPRQWYREINCRLGKISGIGGDN